MNSKIRNIYSCILFTFYSRVLISKSHIESPDYMKVFPVMTVALIRDVVLICMFPP